MSIYLKIGLQSQFGHCESIRTRVIIKELLAILVDAPGHQLRPVPSGQPIGPFRPTNWSHQANRSVPSGQPLSP